jgi:hypothetical protein
MISASLAFRELQKPTADNSRKYTQMNNTRDDLDHTKKIRSIVADLIIIYNLDVAATSIQTSENQKNT